MRPHSGPDTVPAVAASLPLSIGDVREAAGRLGRSVVRTPVLRSPTLDARAGTELYLKAENLQHIGAFKARGALHAAGRLDPAVRAHGLLTYSSGNHAQAVALAARTFGVSATITMPTDAPSVKVAGVRALGATVVFAGTTSEQRRVAAVALAEQHGGTIIPPFDDPHIIAGAGTATLELLEDVHAQFGHTLDALVIPVGGGGLLAGACLATQGTNIAIHAVEPRTCDALAQSLAAGHPVDVQPGPTLADGLKPVRIGALNFEIASGSVRATHTVDDHELVEAVVALTMSCKVVAEASGAAALAVALRGLPNAPRRVGVMISGGNVESARLASWFGQAGASP